jgi:hypothetical protein
VFIGPVYIHLKKDKESYLHFIQFLLKHEGAKSSAESQLRKIKLCITDDDPALHGPLSNELSNTTFGLCLVHLQRNITKQLKEFNMSDKERDEVFKEIFGTKENRSGLLFFNNFFKCKLCFNKNKSFINYNNNYVGSLQDLCLRKQSRIFG